VALRTLPILFLDERLVAVDKPPGWLSVPDASTGERSVPEALRAEGLEALAVHRLDREVSGLLLLARDAETREALQQLFRGRRVEKTYWGLAAGKFRVRSGQFTDPILETPGGARVSAQGKPARTRYAVLAVHPATTELELQPLTGRKNQIRVHLAHAAHPLIGERKYARGKEAPLGLRSRRVALHAWRLALVHPWSGKKLALEAPLPADLLELRQRARAT
jgi:RluA family pseudouridine synthase